MKTKLVGAVAALALSLSVAVVLINGTQGGPQQEEPQKQAKLSSI